MAVIPNSEEQFSDIMDNAG